MPSLLEIYEQFAGGRGRIEQKRVRKGLEMEKGPEELADMIGEIFEEENMIATDGPDEWFLTTPELDYIRNELLSQISNIPPAILEETLQRFIDRYEEREYNSFVLGYFISALIERTVTDYVEVERMKGRRDIEPLEINLDVSRLPHKLNYLGYRNPEKSHLTFTGDVGDFFAAEMLGGRATVKGNVGNSACKRMSDGEVIVERNAGRYFAAEMLGGRATVKGNVGSLACEKMFGGEAVFEGDVGDFFAAEMLGGRATIKGNAGRRVGYRLHHAESIEIRGKIKSCGDWLGKIGNLVLGNVAIIQDGRYTKRGQELSPYIQRQHPEAFKDYVKKEKEEWEKRRKSKKLANMIGIAFEEESKTIPTDVPFSIEELDYIRNELLSQISNIPPAILEETLQRFIDRYEEREYNSFVLGYFISALIERTVADYVELWKDIKDPRDIEPLEINLDISRLPHKPSYLGYRNPEKSHLTFIGDGEDFFAAEMLGGRATIKGNAGRRVGQRL